jgi:hypothetical protein
MRPLFNDGRMKRLLTAIFAFAALVPLQPDMAANARGGMGGHSFHGGGHFRGFHHQGRGRFARNNQNQWLWYGGYYTLPQDVSAAGDVTSSVPVMYVPVRVASCHKVQEAMTVPSEEGGTRQVTVTRCQ